MEQKIRALEEEDIRRLAASSLIPKFSEVYLGLVQNSTIRSTGLLTGQASMARHRQLRHTSTSTMAR
jgi:hypothetical protein